LADKFYSTNKGAQVPLHVTEAGASSGGQVELRVNDTIYNDLLAVQMCLMAIEAYLQTKETRPIA
jgi:hypothetical protein